MPIKEIEEVINAGLRRGSYTREEFLELVTEQRQYAFTIAGFENLSNIEQVKDSLDAALAKGESFTQWKESAEKTVEDLKSLSDNRKKVIFRNHMGVSKNQGAFDYGLKNKRRFPNLRYVTARDDRVRPTHAANDGVTRPIEDPFWETNLPPLGFGCRCEVINITKGASDLGGTRKKPDQNFDSKNYGKGQTPPKVLGEIRKKTGKADKGWGFDKVKPIRAITNLYRKRSKKLPDVITKSLIEYLTTRTQNSEQYLQKILRLLDLQ